MTTINGVTAMEIDFRETGSPTMIQMLGLGRDVASQGTIWVIPSDGNGLLRTKIERQRIRLVRRTSSCDSLMSRSHATHGSKLWLPAKMTERHDKYIKPAILGAPSPSRVTVAPEYVCVFFWKKKGGGV